MNASGICDCCEGIGVETPAAIVNRPGLPAITFRAGTWATFKASMLALLARSEKLQTLRTRSDDDFSIALLDAWAIACDILTFYSERGANEQYVRTATDLISVTEMAKLIGYKARPGVAAATMLAFTLESPPALPPSPTARRTQENSVPSKIELAAGTQVRSIPGPGETAVTFETSAPIEARYAWNELRPRLTWLPDDGTKNLFANVRLAGLFGDLKPGDMLLVVVRSAPDAPSVQRISRVTLDPPSQTTTIVFDGGGHDLTPAPLPTATPSFLSSDLSDMTLWSGVKRWLWPDQADFLAQATANGWDLAAVEDDINALRGQVLPFAPENDIAPIRVFRLGVRASLFGHNAPLWDALPLTLRFKSFTQNFTSAGAPKNVWTEHLPPYPDTWEGKSLSSDGPFNDSFMNDEVTVDLDGAYGTLGFGDYLVLQAPDGSAPFPAKIIGQVELSRSDYLISAKLSRVYLDVPTSGAPWDTLAAFGLRTTRVLGTSGELPVAPILAADAVSGSLLLLGSAQLGLKVGQSIVVTGTLATTQGETANETAKIASLALVDGYTSITLDPQLANAYVRETVTINANVVLATHGESRSEIIGSGDATRMYQRFKLNALPLTYVSAATPSGVVSTLTVRVNGVAWTEVDWLFGHGPLERVYTSLPDENAARIVQLGDGRENGARAASGTNNILAQYRQGLGRGGNVRAGQLSMLQSRPLGLKGTTNPLPASGGADPETADSARANAPITVRALDRIVSLEDFGNFARASAGIAKAAATWAWTGTQQAVCVTVAGPDGNAIPVGTPAYRNLLAAFSASSDGMTPTVLRSYVAQTFDIAATLIVDPTLDPAAVLVAVKVALRAAFSFDARAFAQPVFRSEAIAVIQDVPGVVALTLDGFGYTGQAQNPQADALIATGPVLSWGSLSGATLLTLARDLLPGVVTA